MNTSNKDIRELIADSQEMTNQVEQNTIKTLNKSFKLKDNLYGNTMFDKGLFVIKTIDINSESASNYIEGSIVRDSVKKSLYVCETLLGEKKWVAKTSNAVLPDGSVNNTYLHYSTNNGYTWEKAAKVIEQVRTLVNPNEPGTIVLFKATASSRQEVYICIENGE